MPLDTSILWRRNDTPGHEALRLVEGDAGWTLNGLAVFAHEGLPCRLAYVVRCDAAWVTTSVHVSGRIGNEQVGIVINAQAGEWALNAAAIAPVTGCLDVDLNFSPSTNLLPIRRLGLAVGEAAEVRAAWLRFPQMRLEPLVQTYERIGERKYRYRSATFSAELDVSDEGLPTRYGDLWVAEARC